MNCFHPECAGTETYLHKPPTSQPQNAPHSPVAAWDIWPPAEGAACLRRGVGGGGWGLEEVNSLREYRPMSCFICKAQAWLNLLTASHVLAVDRTTAGSSAYQWERIFSPRERISAFSSFPVFGLLQLLELFGYGAECCCDNVRLENNFFPTRFKCCVVCCWLFSCGVTSVTCPCVCL